jgi:hypothetical protein
MSEQNMVTILSGVEDIYRDHKRNSDLTCDFSPPPDTHLLAVRRYIHSDIVGYRWHCFAFVSARFLCGAIRRLCFKPA